MRKVPMNRLYPLRKLAVALALVLMWASYATAPAASSAADDVEQRVNAILSRMPPEERLLYARTGRQYLSRSDERPKLRIPGRGSVSRFADCGRVYRGNAERGRQRHRETLFGK